MRVDAGGIGSKRGRNRGQRGKRFPGDGKTCQIEIFHRLRIADDGGNCLTPESGFGFGKYGLVGKSRNHAVAVLARNIFCCKNAKSLDVRAMKRRGRRSETGREGGTANAL